MREIDIKKIRDKIGVSQEKLAEMIGVSLRTIQNYEAGGVIPKSKYVILHNITSVSTPTEAQDASTNIHTETIISGKLIPLYDAEAAAGAAYGMSMEPARPIGMIEIGGLLKDSESALRVYGNSMTPNYPAGCVVGLRPHNDSFIEPGSVYVVETADNRYLKRLYYNKDKTAFRCMSDNHMAHDSGPMLGECFYPDFEIPFDDVRRLFRVVGVVKRNIL